MKKLMAIFSMLCIFNFVGCCDPDSSNYDECMDSWGDIFDSSSSSSSSSNKPPPGPALITSIDTLNTVITFNLSDNNIASLSTIQSKITIRKGGFTGSHVSFIVVQISPTQYNLQSFVLSPGPYYITFESGAFRSSTIVSQSGATSFSI